MEIILDGKTITDKQLLFAEFRKKLPDLYGDNLDALWDVLSYINKRINIRIYNMDLLKRNLEDYADKLLILLYDLIKINNKVSFVIL